MAQYFTDFTEYSTGSQPSDWTNLRDSGGDWTVESDSDGVGDRILLLSGGDEFSEEVLTWDVASGSDVEILVKWRQEDSDDTSASRPILRAQGGSNRNHYFSSIFRDGENQWIEKYTDDTYSDIGSGGGPDAFSFTSWTWTRFRINGSSLHSRSWDDGTSEPSDWHVEATDSDHSSGETGLGRRDAGPDLEFDKVGVGTEGDAAPSEEVGFDITIGGDEVSEITIGGQEVSEVTIDGDEL